MEKIKPEKALEMLRKKGVDISFMVTGVGMLATAVNLSKII